MTAQFGVNSVRTATTVIVGAGHAGLAMSRCLAERSIDHVLLERGAVANSWRTERWDSLRLLTPNWQSRLRNCKGRQGGLASWAVAQTLALASALALALAEELLEGSPYGDVCNTMPSCLLATCFLRQLRN